MGTHHLNKEITAPEWSLSIFFKLKIGGEQLDQHLHRV